MYHTVQKRVASNEVFSRKPQTAGTHDTTMMNSEKYNNKALRFAIKQSSVHNYTTRGFFEARTRIEVDLHQFSPDGVRLCFVKMNNRINMRRLESSGENMDGFLALLIMMVFIFCAAWYVTLWLSVFIPVFSHRNLFL
jgi:hypothetical protein